MNHDYPYLADGRTGNGGAPSFHIYKVDSSTGAISTHGRKHYDWGIEDAMDAFEFYGPYFMISYTISSSWFG